MTAASPPPPRDGELPWCNLSFCPDQDLRGQHRIETGRCIVVRPAAPSEPPAADSPTPGNTDPDLGPIDPDVWADFETTCEPPAETQQDDDLRDREGGQYVHDALTQLAEQWVAAERHEEADLLRTMLAARPSADTETLREQVETWIDEAPEQTAGLDLLRQIIGRPR